MWAPHIIDISDPIHGHSPRLPQVVRQTAAKQVDCGLQPTQEQRTGHSKLRHSAPMRTQCRLYAQLSFSPGHSFADKEVVNVKTGTLRSAMIAVS